MPAVSASKWLTMCGWDSAPHMDDATKEKLLASYPAHERDARTKGVPSLGSGAIYPIPESEITCAPFAIPAYWPRSYALDVGWNRTAAVWGAWDRSVDVLYLYTEHYRGQAEPAIHADAIKARGGWIPGVIDPASRGRNQKDGEQLIAMYRAMGLDIETADNAVESGIYDVWQRLSSGRLKVFTTMRNWLAEYRLYRRDENGKIVKAHDHLMDATRYLIKSGLDRSKVQPINKITATIPNAGAGDSSVGY